VERKVACDIRASGEFSGDNTPAKTFSDAIGIGIVERMPAQYRQAVGA